MVIQNLALVLRYLVEEGSFLGALQKAQAVGALRPRRASTLLSIATWAGYQIQDQIEVTLGEGSDRQWAVRAESYIRNAILFLWKRFDMSVDVIRDGTKCMRATEGPRRTADGSFDVAIPQSRCKTRECNNANFFRENLPLLKKLRDGLEAMKQKAGPPQLTKELETALKHLTAAINNPSSLYDYKTCVGVGDVWMHLECIVAGVKDFATTNYKESQILCPILNLTMQHPGPR